MSPAEGTPPTSPPQERAPAKLLLVDDNALNRERLAQRLQGHGYQITPAESGPAALGILRQSAYDLVLLDSMMPGMTGEAVLREIKADPALHGIPVIMISGLDEIEIVARCIEQGAEDYVSSPFDPVLLGARIDACLDTKRLREQEVIYLRQLQKEKQHSDQLVNVVIPIGVSLLEERDLNRLLEMILVQAMALSGADGGTLYLRTDETHLKFVILHNDSLNISFGGASGKPIPFPPLNLVDPATGQPNFNQVACYVALTGKSVNLPDAYDAQGFDFHGTRAFDQRTGYRSKSFLTVPLKNKRREVIGVLQLINAQDPRAHTVVSFDPALQQSIESLSLLAAAALESYYRANPSGPAATP